MGSLGRFAVAVEGSIISSEEESTVVTSTFFFDHTRSPSASEVSGLASALAAMFSSRGGSRRVRSSRSNNFLLSFVRWSFLRERRAMAKSRVLTLKISSQKNVPYDSKIFSLVFHILARAEMLTT